MIDLLLAIVIPLAISTAVACGIGAGLGWLLRHLAYGCARPKYVRDLSLAFTIVLVLPVAPATWFLMFLPTAGWAAGRPGAALLLPLLLPLAGAFIASFAGIRVKRRCAGISKRERRGQCHSCGYDLRNIESSHCPECAVPIAESHRTLHGGREP